MLEGNISSLHLPLHFSGALWLLKNSQSLLLLYIHTVKMNNLTISALFNMQFFSSQSEQQRNT